MLCYVIIVCNLPRKFFLWGGGVGILVKRGVVSIFLISGEGGGGGGVLL